MSGDQKRSIMDEIASAARPNKAAPNSRRPPLSRETSRFWFKLGGPSSEEQRQASFEREMPIPVDQEIITRALKYQKALPRDLESRIKTVREFFLSEIGPLLMAGSTGAHQAKSVMEQALGSPVDDSTEWFFNQFMTKAANLKLSRFVSDLFELGPDGSAYLLNQLNYKRTITMEAPEPRHPIGDDVEFAPPKRSKSRRINDEQEL